MRSNRKDRPTKIIGAGRMISDRELMLYTSAFLWAATGIGIFIAGVVAPELAPNPPWLWRVVCSSIGAVAIWSNLTWMKRLDDVRVYQVSIFWCVMTSLVNGALMIANPIAIGALFMSLLAPTIFAAEFFTRRATIGLVALVTCCAIVPVLAHYSEVQSVHLVSRVSAFVPIMWAVAIAVFAKKSNANREIEASSLAADFDALTGLGNVRALEGRADEILSERNARISGNAGLLLIDLDDFKIANTLHGHAGGDHVLRAVGEGLQLAASKNHLVARIGGDEFAVLIENADERDIGDLAIRYRNAVLSASKRIGLEGVAIDASIGAALAPDDGKSLEELMTAADRAMYVVKDRHTAESEESRKAELTTELPNEFLQPAGTPAWQQSAKPESQVQRGWRMSWRNRPAHNRFASMTWALGVTVGLISLLMPDSDHTHLNVAVIALLGGYGVAAFAYLIDFEVGSMRHLANDVFTLVCIAFIAYLTGGSASPLWPNVFLFIIYEAWFLDAKQLWFRLAGPVAVILLPLLYEGPGNIAVPVGASLYSGVLVAIGVTIAMSYNQFFLEKTRRAAELMSKQDARTGLANRREFEHVLQAQLDALAYRATDALAIVMLDLDNFKNVNTLHGHKAGDKLLERIGAALASCAREGDCVARVGGDEFAVAIPNVDAATAQRLARRLVDAVADCTATSDLAACREVTASAGFALYGLHGRTLDELINAADVALMSVKTSGKGVERVSDFVVSL